MRKLILFLLICISAKVNAQVYQEMPQYGYRANRMAFDSTLQIPTTCGVPTLRSNVTKKSAIAFDSCNNKLYRYNPKTFTWSEVSGGGGFSFNPQGLDSVMSVYNRAIGKNMFITTDSFNYKGFNFYLNNNPNTQSYGSELFIGSSGGNLDGIGIASGDANIWKYGKIRFYNINEGEKTLQFPNGANGTSIINFPPQSINQDEDTLATLADIRNANGSTIDTTNQFVNSVALLNDSSIRVIKGTSTTDIIIKSVSNATNAQRLSTTVYNNSGATITKGTVVYINGRHSSNFATILPAQANNENNSYKTFAIVNENIAYQSTGLVIQAGNITGLNLPTSTFTDGDIVYLSPTVAGGITNVKPLAPNHICKLGSVTRAHPTLGSIEIKIENGWQLDELSDVQLSAVPNDLTLLQFSRVDSLWHDVSVTNAIGSNYIKPTDTTAMLSKYLRKTDTATLSNRINLKLNISDTSTMLSNYSTRINGKLNISDTSNLQSKSISANSFLANNTNATANATAQYFKDTSGTYTGTITWNGTAPTSGTFSYRWTRIGKMVNINISLVYGTAGTTNQQVVVTLPADAPTPSKPAGLTSASNMLYPVITQINATSQSTLTSSTMRGMLRSNSANNGFEFFINCASTSAVNCFITCTYFTD